MYNGTEVFDFDANDLAVAVATTMASTLNVTGLTTMATGATTGDHTMSLTLTAGADGVGTSGEQLQSGGAAAEMTWAAAGSLRDFKNVLEERTDTQAVLEQIVNTPVYDFTYKTKGDVGERMITTGDYDTTYTGVMADEAPWAMHYGEKILNPVNTFGYALLAIKALNEKIEELEARLDK
jgi:hypothetical protein